MDQTRGIVIAAGIALLVSVLIIGAILFLNNLLKNNKATPTPAPRTVVTSSAQPQATEPGISFGTPVPQASSLPTTGTESQAQSVVVGSFVIPYPSSWGLLSCSNSNNIEFDPYTNTDQRGVSCSRAVKPITVLLVNSLTCQGQTVTLGGNQAVKSVDPSGGRTDYKWCLHHGNQYLEISHRTSPAPQPATSKDDFSSTVEEMISKIQFSAGS